MSKTRSIGNVKHIGGNKYILRISAGFDEYGKRIQLSRTIEATSETDAERQLMKFYSERDKLTQARTSEAPTTLQGLYDEFEKNHINKLRPNTQDYYTNMWTRYLKEYGKTKLKSLTPKSVYGILDKTKVGDKTKRAVYGMLFTMCRRGVNWGYMDKNPCENVDPPKYIAAEKRPYNETELTDVIEAMKNEPVRNQLFFYCAAMLGMRRSEIAALKWGDIDFEAKTVSIRRAAGKAAGRGAYAAGTKNTRSERVLNLPDTLATLFRLHRAEQNEHRFKLGSKWIDEGWVFTKWGGGMIYVDTLTNTWTDFLKAHPKLEKTNFNALRHTAATLMIKNNVAVSTVSGILGHAQTSTTLNIYTHAIEDAKKEALHTMENIFNLKPAKTKV